MWLTSRSDSGPTLMFDGVFAKLRNDLGWINRGTHHVPRIHDLRHTFVVRRILLWQQHGVDVDVDEAMLALSTYVTSGTRWSPTPKPDEPEPNRGVASRLGEGH
jgi:integrase